MKNDPLMILAETTSYVIPFRYVSGRITEYDIVSANISILHMYGEIDDTYYEYLKQLPKHDREVEIGKWIAEDKSIYDTIQKGIIAAKYKLFTENGIAPESVVRIANDAVYINQDYDLKKTTFEEITFKKKLVSSSMMNLNNLLFFYRYEKEEIYLEVIGLGKEAKMLHADYMLSFIGTIMHLVERVSVTEALQYLSSFYEDYVNLKLERGFYRELNSVSSFRLKGTGFLLYEIKNFYEIEIGYNLYLIRELWSILLELYQMGRR